VITELGLEGFRSFRDKQIADLAPLTFVYGPNSAGKSSIIKSLLLLQQSIQLGFNQFPLMTGPIVDLGSVWDTVHGHKPGSKMAIEIQVIPTPESRVFRRVSLEFGYSIEGHQDDEIRLNIDSRIADQVHLRLRRCGSDLQYWALEENSLRDYSTLSQHMGLERANSLFEIEPIQGVPVFSTDGLLPGSVVGHAESGTIQLKDATGLTSNDLLWNRLAADLVQQFRSEMSTISYLGPLRKPWSREEDISVGNHGKVGPVGEHSLGLLKARPELLARVNKSLDNVLECGYRLHLNTAQYAFGGQSSRIRTSPRVEPVLEHLISGVFISPVDAGFGLSQLLPIVVEMHLRERSLILIEQPELHLHPRLQARVGQLLRDAVTGQNQNRFLIETHSEHLILRIRRLIRQGLLDPKLVRILYVNNQESEIADPLTRSQMISSLESNIITLRLDDRGDFIDPWPNGFFDERLEELPGWENNDEIMDQTGGFGRNTDLTPN
jgi:predicted ATPase